MVNRDDVIANEQSAGMTLVEFDSRIIPAKYEPHHLGREGILLYQSNGMAGEAGEVANEAKKMVRNREMDSPEREANLVDECGDVLFYMSRLLRTRGKTLEDAANALLTKLDDQKAGRR